MSKFNMEEAVKRLVNVFEEVLKGSQNDTLDKMIEAAREKLNAKTNQTKKEEFEKLLDSQYKTLEERGCPEQIIEGFKDQRNEVLNKLMNMEITKGNIPAIPVIKKEYLGFHGLMSMVRHNGKTGYTYLDPFQITNEVETPNKLYYIFNVNDGTATKGRSITKSTKIIKKQNLLIPITEEVIAIGTHTDVLTRLNMDTAGSRCSSSVYAPLLYRDVNGRPELNYISVVGYGISDWWGSPSVGSRS